MVPPLTPKGACAATAHGNLGDQKEGHFFIVGSEKLPLKGGFPLCQQLVLTPEECSLRDAAGSGLLWLKLLIPEECHRA